MTQMVVVYWILTAGTIIEFENTVSQAVNQALTKPNKLRLSLITI